MTLKKKLMAGVLMGSMILNSSLIFATPPTTQAKDEPAAGSTAPTTPAPTKCTPAPTKAPATTPAAPSKTTPTTPAAPAKSTPAPTTPAAPSKTTPAPTTPAATPAPTKATPSTAAPTKGTEPLSMNYVLDKVEDSLEKNLDKQFKVDWDFEIIYHDGKVFLVIEYDEDDAKAFKKISSEDLNAFVTKIAKEITSSLNKEVEIEGIIVKDDAKNPCYTFVYKNGKLDMK